MMEDDGTKTVGTGGESDKESTCSISWLFWSLRSCSWSYNDWTQGPRLVSVCSSLCNHLPWAARVWRKSSSFVGSVMARLYYNELCQKDLNTERGRIMQRYHVSENKFFNPKPVQKAVVQKSGKQSRLGSEKNQVKNFTQVPDWC